MRFLRIFVRLGLMFVIAAVCVKEEILGRIPSVILESVNNVCNQCVANTDQNIEVVNYLLSGVIGIAATLILIEIIRAIVTPFFKK
ncbi:hypothetical protein [Pantoea agglomerans]|uniref:hypothetical protein n=1 Tax=Enterobacter agglomerans TaxID=549 RepID=UPI000E042862|nr:hypothetical protein [Pantoea agglomerans]SUC48978.1 Uncharacterised protein [Pantoea agglomerans]